MRFIFKLFLGMIIFNAFLFIFTAEFGGEGGQDISSADDSLGYDINSASFAVTFLETSGGIFLAGLLADFITKNHVWTGAGALCGLIFGLYSVSINPIANMFESYPFIDHIWAILTFSFGVIALIAVVEIFTGRSVDD